MNPPFCPSCGYRVGADHSPEAARLGAAHACGCHDSGGCRYWHEQGGEWRVWHSNEWCDPAKLAADEVLLLVQTVNRLLHVYEHREATPNVRRALTRAAAEWRSRRP